MRPYGDAHRTISSAWKHLAKRRTRGDNAARKMLRGVLGNLAYGLITESLRLDYAPQIAAWHNTRSTFLTKWKGKTR